MAFVWAKMWFYGHFKHSTIVDSSYQIQIMIMSEKHFVNTYIVGVKKNYQGKSGLILASCARVIVACSHHACMEWHLEPARHQLR